MTGLLQEKVAVVTGASRGIGKAIALEFARQGVNLVLNASKPSDDLEATKAEVTALGVEAETVCGSVAEKDTGEHMATAAVDRWGRLDILVNNAGVTSDKPLMLMGDDDWERVVSTNLGGVFQSTRAAIRPMMQQRNGRIISISSISAISGRPGQANYAAAKAGISGFTKSMARELGKFNITANGLLVGLVDTKMTKRMPPKQLAMLKGNIPLGRLGAPEDIAGPCVFLASDMANYVTGALINVSGGSYI